MISGRYSKYTMKSTGALLMVRFIAVQDKILYHNMASCKSEPCLARLEATINTIDNYNYTSVKIKTARHRILFT